MKLKQMRYRDLGCLVVLIVFSLSLSGCAVVDLSLFPREKPLEEKVVEGKGPGKILITDISGVLSYEEREKVELFREGISLVSRVKEELRLAAEDSEIRAVVLRIYSPGGEVNASDLLYHEIQRFKNEKQVKVVACFMGLATSGAYYVAASSDYIVAQPTTLTGSIGVIAFKINLQGLMEKVGIEDETITSGDKKDIWSPLRPATEEEREIFQEIIDEYQQRFLDVVRKGRPQVTQEDLKTIADGRVLSGRQALELHLVDEIGYLSDAVRWAREASGSPTAQVVMYHRPGTYVENIYSRTRVEGWSWLENLQRGRMWPSGISPHFMYLWMP
jgi:protease-4